MNGKELAQELKKTLLELREKGVEQIRCDDMISYLDEIIKSPSSEIPPVDIEAYKAKLQVWVEDHKGFHASRLEMFRSVITSGQNALRTAFLMNGGATVALLAFLGKFSDGGTKNIKNFFDALLVFGIGVLIVTMTSGFAYLSQWFYAGTDAWNKKTGFIFNIVAILLGFASYGLFMLGVWKTYRAFIAFA